MHYLFPLTTAALLGALVTALFLSLTFRAWLKGRSALALSLFPLALLVMAAAPAGRDYLISTLIVYPAAAENGTNSVRFQDKTGTNWVALSPTNSTLVVQWQGTNYGAVMSTNLFLTNGGVAYPVKIRNGLWVQ